MQNRINILAICASPRRGSTQKHLEYTKNVILRAEPSAEVEIVRLKDFDIKPCLGCTACYDKSETDCPLDDGLGRLIQKMRASDGVIFASPTYVMNVSGLMKNFIDRLSYVCHRSEFFKKEAMLMTTCAGKIGSGQTLKSLGYAVSAWGFHIPSCLGIVTGHYTPQEPNSKNRIKIEKAASNFLLGIKRKKYLKPSFKSLVGFKYRQICYRSAVKLGMSSRDLSYWAKNGLLSKKRQYFLPGKINILKRIAVLGATYILTLLSR